MYVMQALHKLNSWIVTAANKCSLSCWQIQLLDSCFSQQSPWGEKKSVQNNVYKLKIIQLFCKEKSQDDDTSQTIIK
jgi:hypothetical protein